MKQVIFIFIVLISFNLSAQRVNKYGQKMVSKIIFEDVWDNNEIITIDFSYNTNNELIKYKFHNSYEQNWSAELINNQIKLKFENETIDKLIKVDNGLIKQIVEIYGGRKEVTNYEYMDVYNTQVPYIIRADYKPYFINKKGIYDLYEDDAVIRHYNYYQGVLVCTTYDFPKERLIKIKKDFYNDKHSIENINIDITFNNFGISDIFFHFYEYTEWMPKGKFYFKKDINGFDKTKFEYDNNDNLIQVKYYVIDKDNFKEKYIINIEYVH